MLFCVICFHMRMLGDYLAIMTLFTSPRIRSKFNGLYVPNDYKNTRS
jgi:hypothetical protein